MNLAGQKADQLVGTKVALWAESLAARTDPPKVGLLVGSRAASKALRKVAPLAEYLVVPRAATLEPPLAALKAASSAVRLELH